jgi:hypothetical protein
MSRAADRLLRAIAAHVGPPGDVRMQSDPWVSATFSGERHTLWFDAARGAQLDAFRHDLHKIEFEMVGGFVADIELIERAVYPDHERLGLAVLTIELS